MKWLYIVLGVLLGVVVLYFGAVYGASELGGEVVVLHRKAADGGVDRVRVWIVEEDGDSWIEHGGADAPWIAMLAADPRITLDRQGEPGAYRAVADGDAHERYHALRREKYGWADELLEVMMGSECTGLPVRIERIE